MKQLVFASALLLLVTSACAPRQAKKTKDVNFRTAVGMASWYGPGLHGNLTANGERFDKNDMTAAHRTLPFNSCVRVKNLGNGREATVRINDRGPYAKGRIIDVSEAAAKKLGFIEKGVAKVELRPCD